MKVEVDPVSYTHLDVYKRQNLYISDFYQQLMVNVKIYRCVVVKAALVDVTATATGIDTVERF